MKGDSAGVGNTMDVNGHESLAASTLSTVIYRRAARAIKKITLNKIVYWIYFPDAAYADDFCVAFFAGTLCFRFLSLGFIFSAVVGALSLLLLGRCDKCFLFKFGESKFCHE